jgi:FkbM family methyltransferase
LIDQVRQLVETVRRVRNPVPLVLDGRPRRRPYTVRTWDGLACELRPGRGDRRGFYETVIRGDYLGQGQRLGPGDTVIDIGANIGCFTLLAAARVGPSGRVIAVEPESATYRQLLRNVAMSGLRNVVPVRVAVGGRSGTARLHATNVALFSSLYESVDGRASGGVLEEVPLVTLSRLMRDVGVERCHYLKIDCEGCEHEILRSLDDATAARLDQITLEAHALDGLDARSLARRLRDLGFDVDEGLLLYARRSLPTDERQHRAP